MKNFLKTRTILLAGCMGSSLLAAPSLAQDSKPDDDASIGLEAIVVTAQRSIETDLQTTPISVTAINGETLAQRGSNTLLDLAVFTPSLSIGSNNGGGTGAGASIAIRGMGVGAPESSAAVGVYVDEVYQPSTFGNLLGLLDVGRVEVLRGPQGTLFGRNTIGGAIQYVSNKPLFDAGASLRATIGNVGRRAIDGTINIPLSETVAIRAAASYDNRGGYVTDDLNGTKLGRSQTTLGRLQLRWTPNEALTVDLKAELARRRDNGRAVAIIGVNPNAQFAGLASILGETRPLTDAFLSTRRYHVAGFNTPDFFKSDMKTYQGVISYEISDSVTVKSISAYVDNRNTGSSDFDMTPLNIFAANRGLYKDRVFSQELQLSGESAGERLHWTLGTYYYRANQSVEGQAGYAGVLGAPTPFGPNVATVFDTSQNRVRTIAGYGQATYDFDDRVSVTLGMRYSHEDVTGRDVTLDLSTKKTFTDWSPHFGLNFKATDDVFLYAKASKGFRAGGFTVNNALLQAIDPAFRNIAAPFDQETAWTYEIGARLELLDNRLRINPTIFYTDWKNIQFQRDIPTLQTIVGATQNAGDARIKGVELEMQVAATDRLLLTASASYLDGEYRRIEPFILNTYPFGFLAVLGGVPGSVVQVSNLSLNSPLQQTPKFKYSIGARYTQPLGNDSNLIASLDWGHTSRQRIGVTDGSSQPLPAYGLLNGRLQFETADSKFGIAVYGTNLLDKYYLTGGDGKGKGFTVGTDQGDVARPREIGVTFSARF